MKKSNSRSNVNDSNHDHSVAGGCINSFFKHAKLDVINYISIVLSSLFITFYPSMKH